MKYGQRYQDEKLASQVSLFGEATGQVVMNEPALEDLPEWNKQLKLEKEKEYIGFFLTGHPLEPFRDELEAVSNEHLISEENGTVPDNIKVGGLITSFSINYDKKNNQYARFQFETLSNEFTVLAFKSYAKFKDLLQEDSKIYLEGTLKIDKERDSQATVFLNHAMPLADLRETKIHSVHLHLHHDDDFETKINKLKAIIQRYPGNKVMLIHYKKENEPVRTIKVGQGVNAAREMVQQLREIVGQANVGLGK